MSTQAVNGPTKAVPPVRKLAMVVLGLVAAVAIMLLAFVTPSIHSGAHDLPLAVSGPAKATDQLTAKLEQAQPGAFDVTRYSSADAAAQAIRERKQIGGIAAGANGVTIQTAAGAGTPYAQLLKSIGTAQQQAGQKVTYSELAPLTKDDPAGSGITGLALPLTFGGMISAVLLSTLFKRSTGLRIAGSLGVAVIGGLVATAIMQYGFGAFDGNFWQTFLGVALGIAAISLTVGGLEMLIGPAGLGIGAVLMMFIANPLSGLGTGPAWLPHPWGTIGQGFPLGAAGTVLRSAAFFDGKGMGAALIVLGCWILLGLLLNLLGGRRRSVAAARNASQDRQDQNRDQDHGHGRPQTQEPQQPARSAPSGWVDPSMVGTDAP